jgi:hypothetical protein
VKTSFKACLLEQFAEMAKIKSGAMLAITENEIREPATQGLQSQVQAASQGNLIEHNS